MRCSKVSGCLSLFIWSPAERKFNEQTGNAISIFLKFLCISLMTSLLNWTHTVPLKQRSCNRSCLIQRTSLWLAPYFLFLSLGQAAIKRQKRDSLHILTVPISFQDPRDTSLLPPRRRPRVCREGVWPEVGWRRGQVQEHHQVSKYKSMRRLGGKMQDCFL